MEHITLSDLNIKSRYQVVCSDLTNFLSYNADEDHFKHELLYLFPSATIITMQKTLIILNDINHNAYINSCFDKKLDKYLKNKKLIFGISNLFNDLFEYKRYEEQAIKA